MFSLNAGMERNPLSAIHCTDAVDSVDYLARRNTKPSRYLSQVLESGRSRMRAANCALSEATCSALSVELKIMTTSDFEKSRRLLPPAHSAPHRYGENRTANFSLGMPLESKRRFQSVYVLMRMRPHGPPAECPCCGNFFEITAGFELLRTIDGAPIFLVWRAVAPWVSTITQSRQAPQVGNIWNSCTRIFYARCSMKCHRK